MKNAIFLVNAVGIFISSLSAFPVAVNNLYVRDDPPNPPKIGVTPPLDPNTKPPLDLNSKIPVQVVSNDVKPLNAPVLNSLPDHPETQIGQGLPIHLHRGDTKLDAQPVNKLPDVSRRDSEERLISDQENPSGESKRDLEERFPPPPMNPMRHKMFLPRPMERRGEEGHSLEALENLSGESKRDLEERFPPPPMNPMRHRMFLPKPMERRGEEDHSLEALERRDDVTVLEGLERRDEDIFVEGLEKRDQAPPPAAPIGGQPAPATKDAKDSTDAPLPAPAPAAKDGKDTKGNPFPPPAPAPVTPDATNPAKDLKINSVPAPAPAPVPATAQKAASAPVAGALPQLKDANGNVIPPLRDANGNFVPPPKDANGNEIPPQKDASGKPSGPPPPGAIPPPGAPGTVPTTNTDVDKNMEAKHTLSKEQKSINMQAKQFAASSQNKGIMKDQQTANGLPIVDSNGNPLPAPFPTTFTQAEKTAQTAAKQTVEDAAKKSGISVAQEIENEDKAIADNARKNSKTFQQEAADEYKAKNPGSSPPSSS